MNSKIKILIGILVIGIVLISGWFILSQIPAEATEKSFEDSESIGDLKLVIKSNKEVYRVGDKIVLKITWNNIGKETFYLFHPIDFHEGQNLIIKDEFDKGVMIFQTIEYQRMIGGKNNFHLLEPNKSFSLTISGTIGIPNVYGYPYKTEEEAKGLYIFTMKDTACYLKLGTYKIQYSYTNDRVFYYDNQGEKEFFDKDVWTGTLASNTITIKIK